MLRLLSPTSSVWTVLLNEGDSKLAYFGKKSFISLTQRWNIALVASVHTTNKYDEYEECLWHFTLSDKIQSTVNLGINRTPSAKMIAVKSDKLWATLSLQPKLQHDPKLSWANSRILKHILRTIEKSSMDSFLVLFSDFLKYFRFIYCIRRNANDLLCYGKQTGCSVLWQYCHLVCLPWTVKNETINDIYL